MELVRAQVQASAQSGTRAPAGASASSSKDVPTRGLWSDAVAEGGLAKVGAAANAMTKRAEAASRELLKAEQSLSSRERAMQGPSAQNKQNKGRPQFNGKAGKGGKPAGKRTWDRRW